MEKKKEGRMSSNRFENDSIECGGGGGGREEKGGVSRNLKVTVRAIDKKERETSVSSLLVVDPVFSTPRLRRRRVNVRSRGKKGEKRFPKRKKPPKEGGRGGKIKRDGASERTSEREKANGGKERELRSDQPKTWQHRPGRVATGICCDRGYDRYIFSDTRAPPSPVHSAHPHLPSHLCLCVRHGIQIFRDLTNHPTSSILSPLTEERRYIFRKCFASRVSCSLLPPEPSGTKSPIFNASIKEKGERYFRGKRKKPVMNGARLYPPVYGRKMVSFVPTYVARYVCRSVKL